MKKLYRVILALAVTVVPLVTLASPALAISNPTTLAINSVYAYRYLTADDQTGEGFLVDFNCDYAVVPAETITDAFLVSFVGTDNATILATVAPYTFVNSGYGHNLAWIHFDGSDANLPAWGGAYTIRLYGNPTLAWTGSPPSTFTG
ncbi:MAG: hypothetical protein JRN35_09720, partial [Nitrososphaerota archaeon]|nr:hypothetical protein [Nitrososphaerota archaeon]